MSSLPKDFPGSGPAPRFEPAICWTASDQNATKSICVPYSTVAEFISLQIGVRRFKINAVQEADGLNNKKHLKNVGPIRYCEPPHAHSSGVATVARRLRIDVHDDNDDDNNNDNDNA